MSDDKFDSCDEWYSVLDELQNKLEKGSTLRGKDASIILANIFANETHGNYEGDLLYSRALPEEEYEITLKLINRGKHK